MFSILSCTFHDINSSYKKLSKMHRSQFFCTGKLRYIVRRLSKYFQYAHGFLVRLSVEKYCRTYMRKKGSTLEERDRAQWCACKFCSRSRRKLLIVKMAPIAGGAK